MHATLAKCSHPEKAEVVFLPNDKSFSKRWKLHLYLTLHCNSSKIIQLNVHTVLWSTLLVEGYVDNRKCWLVLSCPESAIRGIILKLGEFHTFMAFLGCIGQIMEGSGFKELLCLIIADHTIPHMLTGILKGSERIIFYWFY